MMTRDCYTLPDRAGDIAALELHVGDEFEPPALGEVRVRVRAIGLNFADVFTGLGLYGPVSSGQVKGPFVPGLEFSGTVEEVGVAPRQPFDPDPAVVRRRGGQITGFSEEVWTLAEACARKFKVGDHVYGCVRFGAYATQVNVPAHQVRPIPEDWSFEEAAAFVVQSLTIHYALKELAAVETGHTVLIHSIGGGCGLQATAICAALGVTVVGTVGSADKVAVILERFPHLRREQIIVRDRWNFGQQCRDALKAGGSGGFDAVLDAVLGDYFQPGYDAMEPGGRYVVYGAADMTPTHASMGLLAWIRLAWQWLWRPRVDPLELPGANKSVMGFNLIHCFNKAPLLMRLLDELVSMDLPKPRVGLVLPFTDAVQALRTFQSGRTTGKVVLQV